MSDNIVPLKGKTSPHDVVAEHVAYLRRFRDGTPQFEIPNLGSNEAATMLDVARLMEQCADLIRDKYEQRQIEGLGRRSTIAELRQADERREGVDFGEIRIVVVWPTEDKPNGYLGGGARFPRRPGENWRRGCDLTDGDISDETIQNLMNDIRWVTGLDKERRPAIAKIETS